MTTLSETLFQLANIMQKIEENDGEITDELVPILSANECQLRDKVDGYVHFFDAVQANISQTKKTIEKFEKNLSTLKNLESRLKDNVKHIMSAHNMIKIEGNDRSIKLVNAGGVTPIYKPEDLFLNIDTVSEKYVEEFIGLVEEKTVYVLKNKDEFKKAIHENKLHSCYELPRGKYVKFT